MARRGQNLTGFGKSGQFTRATRYYPPMRKIRILVLLTILGTGSAAAVVLAQRPAYPPTSKGDLTDDYFGVTVADPYRWMEVLDSKAVADWIAAQNAVTFRYLASLPMREKIKARITELWDYPKTGAPSIEAGRLFYRRNSGLQKQSPLYTRASLTAPPALVLDPNQLWPDGSTSLSGTSPSPDGRLLAYMTSEGGADWQIVHVRDLPSSRDLTDTVQWMRFSGFAWTKDSKGFFYSRYPEPPAGKVLEAALSGQALYYHRVGTPQSEDRLIYERKDLPTWFIGGEVTEDGRYLLITMSRGSDNTNRLYMADLANPQQPNLAATVKPVIEADGAEYAPIGNVGSVVYLRSDLDAPNRRIIAVDLRSASRASWKTIVPERKQSIETALMAGNRIVAEYLVDVESRLVLFGVDGAEAGEIKLPGAGSIRGVTGRQDSSLMFYVFTSPLYPATVFSYDVKTGVSSPFEAPRPPIDVTRYETKQLFAVSKDGTKVPFFVTARKDLSRDGSNPTMLYGYGGFSISTQPTYLPDVPAFLELGGIWVTANMRGGAEYGESWHRAGMLEMYSKPYIKGLTTNPTLMRKSGIANYRAFAKDILSHINDKPVCFEVLADEFAEMEHQALEIAGWADNVYVKIPITNTKRETSRALVKRLSDRQVKLNVTAIMTLAQLEEVMTALNPAAASYLSVFAGRIADTGIDPLPLMRKAVEMLKVNSNAELVWASSRETFNIFQANAIGCQVITVTNDILNKLSLIGYDLTEYSLDTVKMFYEDARKAGFSL